MAQWTFDPAHSSAEFSVKHFGVSWVKGRFANLDGKIFFDPDKPDAGGSVEAKIDAKSVWTGDAARDNHLRSKDFFDVDRYPHLTFKSTGVQKARENEYKVKGDLTIRGVTKQVTLETIYLGARPIPSGEGKPPVTRAGFSAKTTINRHDFGVSWDMPLGIGLTTVGGEVDITLNIEAVRI
ncbi:MAG: YceI family protein [Parcubacteria group bacterium]|nr:YceI family protein [Parcubacteria group bacterium]